MEFYNAIVGTLSNMLDGFDAAAAVLLAMIVMGGYVMYKAQQQSDFDWADMLRDDNHKPSAFRLAIFVSLAVASWILIYVTLKLVAQVTVSWAATLDILFKWYALYILVYSGAKIAERLVELAYAKLVGKPMPDPVVTTTTAAATTTTTTTGATP